MSSPKKLPLYLNPFVTNANVNLDILLLYTPQGHFPSLAPSGLPYLKGYLNSVFPSCDVKLKDLNAIYLNHVFSSEHLGKYFSPTDVRSARNAYLGQQDIDSYHNIPQFIKNHKTLENALRFFSQEYRNQKGLKKEGLYLNGNTLTYISEFKQTSREQILNAVAKGNKEKNIFFDFYKDKVLPFIAKQNVDVVGVSIYLPDQMIPSMLLTSMIKEEFPKIKIVVGGNYLSRFLDVIGRDDDFNKEIFSYWDALVIKEGEVPFRQILERVHSNKSFEGINQVVHKNDKGNIVFTSEPSKFPLIDMDKLPRPNFDGVFTDLDNAERVYLLPEDGYTFYTRRGCPQSCEFCTIHFANNFPSSRVSRSPDKVFEDIVYFYEKGGHVFSFGNETLTKKFMGSLAKKLNESNLEGIVLDGYTRTDQFIKGGRIDTEFINLIAPVFKFLQIGVESNNEETLSSMKKARNPTNDSELIKTLWDSGIRPHVFLLTGFPPEKKKYGNGTRNETINYHLRDAVLSLQFLKDNAHHILTVKPTALVLPRDDHHMLQRNGAKFEVNSNYDHELKIGIPEDLEFNIPYEKIRGNKKLDKRITQLFDALMKPYHFYTRNAPYHQRLFNMEEGIIWSLQNFNHEGENKGRTKSILRKFWNLSVGKDYVLALQELNKKSGVSPTKMKQLYLLIDKNRRENLIASQFPDPGDLYRLTDLLNMDLEIGNPTIKLDTKTTVTYPILSLSKKTTLPNLQNGHSVILPFGITIDLEGATEKPDGEHSSEKQQIVYSNAFSQEKLLLIFENMKEHGVTNAEELQKLIKEAGTNPETRNTLINILTLHPYINPESIKLDQENTSSYPISISKKKV